MIAQQATVPEPFFADTGNGRRFAIVNRPDGSPRGAILFIPPFAEEMNKSRRMAAQTATALAVDGWLVVRCDLYGCGDSDGDIADGTWQVWIDDLSFWTRWLRGQTDAGPLLLWGFRTGALLTAAWLEQSGESPPLLFWQPVSNGQRYITQFLRLRAAAEMMDSKQSKGVVSRLTDTLRQGTAVTVAGYTLNPALANPMSDARLSLPDRYEAPVAILEIAGTDAPTNSTAVGMMMQKWQDAGIDASASAVTGPPFWQTTEIEMAPAAIEATVLAARDLCR